MGEEYRNVTYNKDGSKTETVRYSDGSGHSTTTKNGKIISKTTFPAKK